MNNPYGTYQFPFDWNHFVISQKKRAEQFDSFMIIPGVDINNNIAPCVLMLWKTKQTWGEPSLVFNT